MQLQWRNAVAERSDPAAQSRSSCVTQNVENSAVVWFNGKLRPRRLHVEVTCHWR